MLIHAAVAGRRISAGLPSLPGPGVLPIVINATHSSTQEHLHDLCALAPLEVGKISPAVPDVRATPFVNGALFDLTGQKRKSNTSTPPGLVLITHTGPDAGLIVDLRPGRYWLGRPGEGTPRALPEGTGILISDPAMSRIHAVLEVGARGVMIFDRGSSNGLWVDGRRVRRAGLSTSSRVRAGNTTFQVQVPGTGAPSPASIDDVPVEVALSPPQRPGAPALAASFLPLLLGTVLAVSTGMWFFLAFSVLGAVTAAAGLLAYRRRRTAFRRAEAMAAAVDRRRRQALHPTLGSRCLAALMCSMPWESAQRSHPGSAPFSTTADIGKRGAATFLRLGTGSLPANLSLPKQNGDWRPPTLEDVPVLLEARPGSVAYVRGNQRDVLGLCRALLLQVGTGDTGNRARAALLGTRADEIVCDARFLPGVQLIPARHESAAAAALTDLASASAGSLLLAVAPPGLGDAAGRIWAGLPEDVRALTCLIACADPDTDASPQRISPLDTAVSLGRDGGTVTKTGVEQTFHPDLLGARAFHRAALRLAASAPRGLPATELIPVSDPAEVLKAWEQNRPFRAAIGHAGGRPVNIHLVEDGPHILIAGTTGAGKSELLRALVSSLACQVSPSRLNFLLIDFKGGSGLAPLTELPHAAGFLTDLSQENVSRALISLRAELRRRESLLAGLSAADIDEFNDRAVPGAALPRLFVVIDEFKMLADAVPGALQELMRIAALGRSLGLHLVMATQRPQGAVTADIRANVSARLCLRVQSAVDSQDVVGCEDAAAIPASSPGRTVLRLPGAAPVVFQAFSTASPPQRVPLVQTLTDFLSAPARRIDGVPVPALDRIVAAVQSAAAAEGLPERASAPVQPPLPAELGPAPSPPDGHLRVGLADRPEEQAQDWLDWAPGKDSHLALVGLPDAGPVAAACALAGQHVTHLRGRHLYVLDGDGSLSWAAGRPQTGAYVPPHETKRAARTLAVMADILLERLAHRADGTHRADGAHRADGDSRADQADGAERPGMAESTKWPGLTVLVSGWGRWQESFRSNRSSTAEDILVSLARDGAAADICLLMTGNRELAAARFFQLLPNRLWFPAGLAEDALLTWPRMPELQPVPGRAFVQGPVVNGAAEGSRTVAQCFQRRWPAVHEPLPEGIPRPRRIDALPHSVRSHDLDPASAAGCFPVGLGGDELRTMEAKVLPGSVFLILGPARSGKTSLLGQFAAAAGNIPGQPGAAAFPARICRIGTPPGRVGEPGGSAPPPDGNLHGWLVLADDADQFPAEDQQLLIRLADRGAGVVLAAVPSYNLLSRLPVAARARMPRNGALLAPSQAGDGEFFGVRVEQEGRPFPGRGYLFDGGSAVEVQFAVPPAGLS